MSTYVAMAQIGNCKVCKQHDDLRMGACFGCSDMVDGEKISPTMHKLWERANPRNFWYVSETHN